MRAIGLSCKMPCENISPKRSSTGFHGAREVSQMLMQLDQNGDEKSRNPTLACLACWTGAASTGHWTRPNLTG